MYSVVLTLQCMAEILEVQLYVPLKWKTILEQYFPFSTDVKYASNISWV